jgi:hypothetical protein
MGRAPFVDLARSHRRMPTIPQALHDVLDASALGFLDDEDASPGFEVERAGLRPG